MNKRSRTSKKIRLPKPQRTTVMSIRLSKAEQDMYRQAAKNSGMQVSDWIRASLCSETEAERQPRAIRALPIADDRLLRRLVEIRNLLDEVRRQLAEENDLLGRSLFRPFVKIEKHLRTLAGGIKCL